jgi:hypothetical protein
LNNLQQRVKLISNLIAANTNFHENHIEIRYFAKTNNWLLALYLWENNFNPWMRVESNRLDEALDILERKIDHYFYEAKSEHN